MKRLTIGIALVTLAVVVAGCAKQSGEVKKAATTENPAVTSQAEHTATGPAEHTTMKPVTPAVGTGQKSTTTPATTPETAKPAAGTPEAGAATAAAKPSENK